MLNRESGEVSPVLSFFGRSKILWIAALVILLVLGASVRFFNLTNPPLDDTAWQQLRSASIARDYYYQMWPSADPATRQLAHLTGQFNKLEPSIFERIVALTYLLVGGEYVWIARIFSILFWLIGGLALFDLSRRATSIDGGLVALGFYLLLQFPVVVSRSFQPDPFMVMWMVLALNTLDRWVQTRSWKWAILTGLMGGLATLTKVSAVFMLGTAAILLIVTTWGIRKTLRSIQVWSVVGIMGVIPAIYILVKDVSMVGGFLREWIIPNLHLLTQVRFYFQWLGMLNRLYDYLVILLAFLGAILLPKRQRWMVLGFWLGYLVYGAVASFSIVSNTYDNLPLAPVLALSLASIGTVLFSILAKQPRSWQVISVVLVLSAALYVTALDRNALLSVDFRQEALRWKTMGLSLPTGHYIGLTHDSNTRLGYYGMVPVAYWPQVTGTDIAMLESGNKPGDAVTWQSNFDLHTQGYDYFIVTLFDELDTQPELKKILEENFPSTRGDGFIYYDLRHKMQLK